MLKNLVKIANRLDSLGLSAEADVIDGFIQKMAARVINPGDFDHDMVVELGGGEWDSESDGEHPHSHFLDRWEKEDSSIKNIITDPEHELYNPHNHGVPSYEMGEGIEDSIDAQISRRRELEDLEEMYPAAKKDSYYDKYDTEEFDKEASRRMRGMRKRS